MTFLLLTRIFALGLLYNATTADDPTGLGGPSGWIRALSALLSIGDAFLSALDRFEEWADEDAGTAMVTIDNYCNNTDLADVKYQAVVGTIDAIDFDVVGGETQGISASSPDFEQTEGLVGWALPNTIMKAVVYWRVPHKSATKKSNILGLGFVNGSNSNWMNDLVTSTHDLSMPAIGMEEYAESGETMQCCSGDLCIQGLMSTNHHCDIKIRILPKNAKELFHRDSTISEEQSYLDEVLDQPNTCTSSCNVERVLSPTLLLLISLLLFCTP